MSVETVILTGGGLTGIAPHLGDALLAAEGVSALPVKLGRRRPKARSRCLRFADYFNPTQATPPAVVDYAAKAAASLRKMYLNDTYGDCVIAGKYHAEGVWSANESGPAATVVGTDQEVYSAYQTICGPGDNGCVITDVLDAFRDRGLTFNGVAKKIDGYVGLDWTNKLEVQVALDLFGAVCVGINLPRDWTTSDVWDATTSPIIGGHDVTAVGYDAGGVQVASWGRVYTITWDAFLARTWVEEAYAMLAPDWYAAGKLAPSGVDAAALRDDLAKLAAGTIPPLDPTPPTPPGPVPTPPVPPPNYAGTLQGTMSGPFGTHPFNGTLTLRPVPADAAGAATARFVEQLRGVPNWFAVLEDAIAVMAAIRSVNVPAIIAAVGKMAADLGVVLPPLPGALNPPSSRSIG